MLTVRVSSPIDALDPDLLAVQTRSGRLYRLDGPPARHWRMRKLILSRLTTCGHEDALDITDLFWDKFGTDR